MLMSHLQLQLKEKETKIEDLTIEMDEKQTEIDKFDEKLMNLKDEQLDYESKMEKRFDSHDQAN